MDRSLAQQLTTDWKEGFSGELASNDLIEVQLIYQASNKKLIYK